jgi:diguanylate cyclase (GGDEF)-like protein
MRLRRPSAAVLRTLTLGTVLVLALGLILGAGQYLRHSQAAAEDKVHRDFADLGRLTAKLTGDSLAGSDGAFREFAVTLFSGPEADMPAAVKQDHSGLSSVYILRSDGTVLGFDPPARKAEAEQMKNSPLLPLANKSKTLFFGNAFVESKELSLRSWLPYSTPEGRRFLVSDSSLEQVNTFAKAYVTSALGSTGGQAYILDGQNKLITSSKDDPIGQPMRNTGLLKAADQAAEGRFGGDYYVTLPIPASSWRLIFAAPEDALMAPIESSTRVSWQLFGAFVVAMLMLLAIGAMSLLGSARLAHARLHDALTGLPNRALFIDRTKQAISERRQDGPIAALFIDLDGFKPINDTHGHAVGDALLRAVSGRLLESMRPGDYVSRFGGDEFLVLCKGLRHTPDALAVADRIQKYIAEPFDVDGKSLSVGTSIGIALVDDHASDAEALIHNADLAMYRAKQSGRGRIEQFTPDMATPTAA